MTKATDTMKAAIYSRVSTEEQASAVCRPDDEAGHD